VLLVVVRVAAVIVVGRVWVVLRVEVVVVGWAMTSGALFVVTVLVTAGLLVGLVVGWVVSGGRAR
jgi:hypothetical protein